MSVCSCRGACLKERGRNTCPCKSMGNYCSEACHSNVDCRKFTCMNKRRLIEGESSSDSSDDSADSTFQLDEAFVSVHFITWDISCTKLHYDLNSNGEIVWYWNDTVQTNVRSHTLHTTVGYKYLNVVYMYIYIQIIIYKYGIFFYIIYLF